MTKNKQFFMFFGIFSITNPQNSKNKIIRGLEKNFAPKILVPWDTPGVPWAPISAGYNIRSRPTSNSSHMGSIQTSYSSGVRDSSRKSENSWVTVCTTTNYRSEFGNVIRDYDYVVIRMLGWQTRFHVRHSSVQIYKYGRFTLGNPQQPLVLDTLIHRKLSILMTTPTSTTAHTSAKGRVPLTYWSW